MLRKLDKEVDGLNLSKLFEMQKVLDDRIVKEKGLEGKDFLDKKILALQVELGELANEWRGFKFWSEDREPRTFKAIPIPDVDGAVVKGFDSVNPLLEEYVDCLHFILSIGLELDFAKFVKEIEVVKNKGITEQFIFIFTKVGTLLTFQGLPNYIHIIHNFIGLGEMLGFTSEQIEQAYISKNEINHARQKNGY